MKKQLIRISILQSSKIMTALYVLMGFIYLVMPVIMGLIGWFFFVIFAAIYNLLATWLGGFEVEVKNMDQTV